VAFAGARAIGVLVAVLATTLGLAVPQLARAAACPVDPSVGRAAPGLAAYDEDTRIRFIATRLAGGARKARAWAIGWGVAYGVASITLFAVTPAVSSGVRTDMYVGGTSAAFGALTRAIMIPRVIRESRRLQRRLASGRTDCATVHAAEAALVRSAKSDRRGRGLVVRLGAIVYNVGVGLVLGLAFDRPVSGARQAAVGATVGQIMIVTQPFDAAKALDRYRDGRLVGTSSVGPLVLPGGGGFALRGAF